jgi:hypothetical protein
LKCLGITENAEGGSQKRNERCWANCSYDVLQC